MLDFTATKQSSVRPTNTSTSRTYTDMLRGQSKTVITVIGVSTVLLLILSSALVLTVVVFRNYKRRSAKQELYTDHSYSTLSRGSEQQIQPRAIHCDSTELYDQVHLSPFTGQTEFIPKCESTNINNPSTTLQNSHPTLSTAGDDRGEHFLALNTAHLATTPQPPSQNTYESTCEQPTYTAVDKSKKEKVKKQTRKEDSKCKVAEKEPHVSSYRNEVPSASMQEKKEKVKEQVINPPHTVEELYTAVKKKPKGSEPKDEEDKIPPTPPHTIEELYTAVEKKPRINADENKEASPKTFVQNTPEDLYTAVTRKLEGGLTDGTEAAPPIPPHTVEELYTAVMKKPKGSAEDEEEVPPIPLYTVDEN